MIIVMKQGTPSSDVEAVVRRVEEMGFKVHLSRGEARTIIGVIGANEHELSEDSFLVMESVEKAMRVMKPFRLASRDFIPTNSVISVDGVEVGGARIVVMAGPCSVEGRSMILETAHAVKEAGATILRGGAYKPRSSPYTFQGLGMDGLRFLAEARERADLATRNQTWTMIDAVLRVFRRRLSVAEGLRFAESLPPLLRAMFVVAQVSSMKMSLSGSRSS